MKAVIAVIAQNKDLEVLNLRGNSKQISKQNSLETALLTERMENALLTESMEKRPFTHSKVPKQQMPVDNRENLMQQLTPQLPVFLKSSIARRFQVLPCAGLSMPARVVDTGSALSGWVIGSAAPSIMSRCLFLYANGVIWQHRAVDGDEDNERSDACP